MYVHVFSCNVPLDCTKPNENQVYNMLYWYLQVTNLVYLWLLPLSLHIHICSYDEALADFEAAIRLQRSLPSPYICTGMIHLLHRENPPRATRCFTAALAIDPTCIRAYLCRAEALKKDGKVGFVVYWELVQDLLQDTYMKQALINKLVPDVQCRISFQLQI